MNTALVVFGIRSVVRLGRVTRESLEAQARDAEAIFPAIKPANFEPAVYVAAFFTKAANKDLVSGADAPYAAYWNGSKPKTDASSIDALLTAAMKIEADRAGGPDATVRAAGAVMVRQWSDSAAPLSPWARVILAAGDIVLEYVAAYPSVLGSDGNGEQLIGAYARNLSELLPDDGNFGAREQFAQRLAGAFLRAGLSTAGNNPGWLVSEEHVAALIGATLQPLAAAFPGDISRQLRWHDVTEALAGPVAGAALRVVAGHPSAFLGKNFDPGKAAGAVTRAVFLEAAEQGLGNRFTHDSLLGLYAAVLGVAAERPDLFVGGGSDAEDKFARKVFSGFMQVLQQAPPPFDRDVGLRLAAIALEAVGQQVHRFADDSEWEQAAADMLMSFTARLGAAMQANTNLQNVFTHARLLELGRTLLETIANTPRMLLGSRHQSWEGVVRAVAGAMAADDKLLLGGDDWMQVATVAAEEAAANPGRLFALDPAEPDDVLAGKLIATVLKAAAEVLAAADQKARAVLYGKTLAQAIEIVLRAAAGNPADVRDKLAAIAGLVRDLNTFVAVNHEHYGSKELLQLFRKLLAGLLDGRAPASLTIDVADRLLQGA